jgi:phosphoribosyl 1,2-cyclic phosphate phosphodiesterase
LRPSILIETGTTTVLVDATPDFRTQALRVGLRKLDAVVLTHTHADHVLGLDEVRVFTQATGRPMPIYGSAESVADVQRIFAYACTDKPRWPSLPSFALRTIQPGVEFAVGDVRFGPVALAHGWMEVLGFVVNDVFAYLTDCHVVPAAVVERVRGVRVLALDGLRHREHPTHLTIAQAVAVAGAIGAEQTWLTHLCHEVEHAATEADLPAEVRLAYDGLQMDL